RFLQTMARQTGIPFAEGSLDARLRIQCDSAGETIQKLGEDESYRLEVTTQRAVLSASNPLGILRGLATFLQLVEPGATSYEVPALVIEDKPRFPWRGLHLDVSRHWMPLEVVKRNLDGMAAVKLNVFHWHLSDDQGFRIESKRFPKLQELGSDGHYYTQDQVREVIAYARNRGIRVVPEFDMPGHATSWFVGYPQLASGPGPYSIERKFGIFDPAMDPSREATYEFLDGFIGEMTALFPDAFFHIGGDEVNGEQWKKTAHIQAFMNDHRIKDNHDLQAYFTKQVQRIVAKHGKRTEGWDEVLAAELPKDIVIQSWQGQKPLAEAARQGYSGILSAGYYLDHMEPASTLYQVDPLEQEAATLTSQEKSRILGGEVCMWSEYISPENVDSRIWPRTAAVAERFWSPQEIKDIASMYRRLDAVSRKLEWSGLTHLSSYLPMLRRMAGDQPIDALKILADVVQPANQDARDEANNTQQTPLNRLVDAARSKSKTARDFAALVDKMDLPQIRAWLILWRENDAKLAPLLEKSFLLKEDIPASRDLSRLAAIGLEALDHHASDQSAFLEQAKKLHAEVELAIVPSIEKLISRATEPRP
ncbi:MAG TPA: family 20 glycosylhydrolase, partial [Bryobacteraceae bacterium]|nr:family 20 glycosylhydrolase [Bryobacteraceae bacterium]